MPDTTQLIVNQLDRMEATQGKFQAKTTDQLSQLNVRLSVVEHDVKELHRRMNVTNGCTGEMDKEIDELQSVVERLEDKKWTRGDKLKTWGIALSAFFALAALVVSVVCH
ncbi:MAG: hypothetical protein AB1384_12380 [Actinomycetota bacterium]